MIRFMMKSKLHRALVTDTRLDYAGSLTVDPQLMRLADLLENEQVHVLDINNGVRFVTYVIRGEPRSSEICVNGAAARLVERGDHVIVLSYGAYSDLEAREHRPRVIVFNDDGSPRIVEDESCLGALLD